MADLIARNTEEFIDDALRQAMAKGLVIVEFSDTSDEDDNNVQFSVRPAENAAPPSQKSDNVELALAQRNAEVLEEKLEEREETLNQNIAGLHTQLAQVQERNKFLTNQLADKAQIVVEKRVIHQRCWGSWILAVLVAVELYSHHNDVIVNWLAWLRN